MTNSDIALLEKLDKYIEKNLDNPTFSIDDVCVELGVSRSQLHRVLTETIQLSTTLYIRKKRLEKAKYLLSTTNLRISEITDAVGINSHANFSKYFFEEFKVSPTDFRRQIPQFIDNSVPESLPIKNEFILPNDQIKGNITPKSYSYWYLVPGLIITISIGLYIFLFSSKNDATQSHDNLNQISDNSLAILPFKNLGSSENAIFCDGVMEQIHGSLSLLENLKVISKSSSIIFRNTKKPIGQIANELHVKYILEGSVLQIDKKIRITVGLTDAREDRSVWTKSYDGNIKDVFGFMSIVAKEVAGELNQKLSSKLTDKINKRPTKSLTAFNEYLQGKQLLQTRTKEKIEASIVKFNKAIELDNDFADAYTDKAVAYYLMGEDQFMEVENAYKMSEKNALTSIRLDSENGRAYAVLGNIYKAQNKWEQAITTYQIALKFSPNDGLINYWYSLTLRSIGQMDEAIKYSTKAVSLDPLASNIYGGHIIGCAYAGKLDMAEKAIKDGELIFNEAYLFHNAKAFFNITNGRYDVALKEFLICAKLNPNIIYLKVFTAYTQAKLGQTTAVYLYLKNLPKIPDNNKYFAIIYAGLGDKENCLKYLEAAAEISDSPNYLKISPLFTFLHHEPRFEAVLKKLGLLNPNFSIQ